MIIIKNKFCIYSSISWSSNCCTIYVISLVVKYLHSYRTVCVCRTVGLQSCGSGHLASVAKESRPPASFTQHRQTGPNGHTADLHSTHVSSKWAVFDMADHKHMLHFNLRFVSVSFLAGDFELAQSPDFNIGFRSVLVLTILTAFGWLFNLSQGFLISSYLFYHYIF